MLELNKKIRKKWWHGTNNPQEFIENGIYQRFIEGYNHPISPCIYLATTKKEASMYGEYVFEVEYDPSTHPLENNYNPQSWQIRVYEPILKKKLVINGLIEP